MYYILLSGGSGTRLWPISNGTRSKQFLELFQDENGNRESMVQRTYRNICAIDPKALITIAASKSQMSFLHKQLGAKINVSIEPCGKDTFPAIALACAYLYDIQQVPLTESVVVCPVDTFVEADYFEALKRLGEIASTSTKHLILMGITPTKPSEKYGYIIPVQETEISPVCAFKEKPSMQMAQQYLKQNALWNGGVFSFKLGYIKKKTQELLKLSSYLELYSNYNNFKKISFDYAVTEKETSIEVMRFTGKWQDIGTWDAFCQTIPQKQIGKCMVDKSSENVYVFNELDTPILCSGINNAIVVATLDGVLVTNYHCASNIKSCVEKLSPLPRIVAESWGERRILYNTEHYNIIEITLNQNEEMTCKGDEKMKGLIVISGSGIVCIDGNEQYIKAGDLVHIKSKNKCVLISASLESLVFLEIQIKGNQ